MREGGVYGIAADVGRHMDLLAHTRHTQNAMGEAGIPVDLSMVSPSASLQQDYAEFKQPDTNGDDKISRREVS